jgi:acetyl-CoA synthetase
VTAISLPDDYNASRLLWDNLPARAHRPAIFHDSGTLTYADVARLASRIGNTLLSQAKPGARVLMFMEDEPAYPAAIMGAMRAGLVPMLINTLSTPDLIAFYLEDSGAEAVVLSDAFAPLFADCPVPVITAADWAGADTDLPEHQTRRDDMAFWMYSSGSTGRPKGIVHSHAHPAQTAATYGARILGMTEDDICFSVPKIFFAYGFGNSVTFPFHFGGAAVLLSGRPTPERVFDAIARHRPTLFFGLPTLYTALCHHEAAASADLSSVRLCLSAAEILSAEIAGAWRDRFGHAIVEGLGSTEMLHIYLSNTPDRQVAGSAGQVVPGYEVRLVDPDGQTAAPGNEGVMRVRGPSAAEYYWNRPDKTAETMIDGWIDTGDRFSCDSGGNYFFRGRADDLVKVSGQWVYPMEVELALNEHPDVRESCVLAVPLPDERLTLAAWVSLKQGVAPDDTLRDALRRHAKAQLLPHKYPREILFLETLPKTGTDKIDRQALRRQWSPRSK